jgi:hypothetical protein
VRLFLAFMYVFYMYNLPFISIFQYRSDIRVLDRTQSSLLCCDAFEHVFAGYTTTEGALISTENVEKYVMCVCCVARRRSKRERIEFCGWTWRKSSRIFFRGYISDGREYSVIIFSPMLHRPTIIRILFSNSHVPALLPS